jgi:hypothetical protein
VRVTDRIDLEFVGEIEERLEEDASSNTYKGEKEEGIVTCGGCVSLCVDAAGDGDVLDQKFKFEISEHRRQVRWR